jgi:2-aminoethylphosphonate-pyruvate transaminase
LYNFYKYASEKLQTPNTPAVQSFIGLEQALANILEEGVPKRHRHIKVLTTLLRKGMSEYGFECLIQQNELRSSVLTTLLSPANFNIEEFRLKLRERNIIIYSGKGPLLNRVFQVGNIGNLTLESVNYFLGSMKECLEEMGYLNQKSAVTSASRHHKSAVHI